MNKLEQLEAFQRILADYKPSEEAKNQLRDVRLVLLVGPSSSGKNTIMNEMVKSGRYHLLVSDTTRKPRENDGVLEQNGREYWFRNEDEVLADLERGMFLEAAIIHGQQVSGTSVREVRRAAAEGKIGLHELDVEGAANIHAVVPDAPFLFIVPPSFEEWLARMRVRGELPVAEVRRRMESAIKEIERALASDFYTFVVNDTFMHTTRVVESIIENEEFDDTKQSEAREIAREILQDTRAHLSEFDS